MRQPALSSFQSYGIAVFQLDLLHYSYARMYVIQKEVLQKWDRMLYYYQIIHNIYLFRLNDLDTL